MATVDFSKIKRQPAPPKGPVTVHCDRCSRSFVAQCVSDYYDAEDIVDQLPDGWVIDWEYDHEDPSSEELMVVLCPDCDPLGV